MAATKKKKKERDGGHKPTYKDGEFAKIYLLYGEERYLVNQYRDKLLSALTDKDDNLNFMKFAGNGIDTSELLAFCNEMPFLRTEELSLWRTVVCSRAATRILRRSWWR